MIQRDYILRMIEQMARMLARILLLKEAGSRDEALTTIENAFKDAIGLDPSLVDSFSIDHLAEMAGISKDRPAGSMKCLMAGRLLKEKAGLLDAGGDGVSTGYYHKALGLLLLGILNIGYTEIDLTGYYSDIGDIESKLSDSLSGKEMLSLFEFYKMIGRYDKAENMVFHLKYMNYPGIAVIGSRFFEDLDLLDETALQRCGLTKDEIREAFEEFKRT